MLIGQRLRDIREAKNLSQADIEWTAGLFRTYISRAENGHTVPSIEILEKWARALRMPLYQVLYEGEEPPKPLKLPSKVEEKLWRNSVREARELERLRRYLAKMNESDRNVLLAVVGRMAHATRS